MSGVRPAVASVPATLRTYTALGGARAPAAPPVPLRDTGKQWPR
ncbi:hypothetical protein [Deinococcus soli (ex Cha et al. 2016)]